MEQKFCLEPSTRMGVVVLQRECILVRSDSVSLVERLLSIFRVTGSRQEEKGSTSCKLPKSPWMDPLYSVFFYCAKNSLVGWKPHHTTPTQSSRLPHACLPVPLRNALEPPHPPPATPGLFRTCRGDRVPGGTPSGAIAPWAGG